MNGSASHRPIVPRERLMSRVNLLLLIIFTSCILLRCLSFLTVDLGFTKGFSSKSFSATADILNDILLSAATLSSATEESSAVERTDVPASDTTADNNSKIVEMTVTENPPATEIVTPDSNSAEKSCFQLNSKSWLEGPRKGNIREGMTTELTKSVILDSPGMLRATSSNSYFAESLARTLLSHSLCMRTSRFLSDEAASETDPQTIRLWATRLIYLAIHYHQHKWAIPEARSRLLSNTDKCEEEMKQHDVGNFDFECPDAKFLLVSMAGVGIGANIRGCATPAFLAGLATDRVVILMNNFPAGPLKGTPWELASCERRDHQCFFMPTTPCTLTHKEFEDAYYMTKHESRQLWNKGKLPDEHANDRVLVAISLFQPNTKVIQPISNRLTSYAQELIATAGVSEGTQHSAVLKAATEAIGQDDPVREGYNFAAANIKTLHSLSFYAMRPNPTSQAALQKISNEIIPEDINFEETIGLPIRASDKCFRESECLTFDQHMQVTSGLWSKHVQLLNSTARETSSDNLPMNPSIIFTTESKEVLKAQQEFSTNATRQAVYPFQFRFVTNTRDIMPGTGKLKQGRSSGDDAMLSSMSSLQAQMMARVSVGNCCSNFHALLSDFMIEGCGSASASTFLCLQEHEDPLLRVCCGWHQDCKALKKKLLANLTTSAA